MHALPHFLAVSKQNAGECMFLGRSGACPRRQFAIAYVQPPHCPFTNDHYVATLLRPCWPSSSISSSPQFKIPPTPSHQMLTTPRMMYSTAPIQKECLASPYAADYDPSPDFHDAADSDSLPDFHDLDSSPYFCDLNPIHHTIPSTMIQSSYLHPPVGHHHEIC